MIALVANVPLISADRWKRIAINLIRPCPEEELSNVSQTAEMISADQAEGDETMETVKIAEYARALFDAHGDKAEAEADQKASNLRAEGKAGEAEQWEKVRKAIHELRSGHVS